MKFFPEFVKNFDKRVDFSKPSTKVMHDNCHEALNDHTIYSAYFPGVNAWLVYGINTNVLQT